MEFLEKFLTLYGPLGFGWLLALLLGKILYTHAGKYITVITSQADGNSAVAATLESLEANVTEAIGRNSGRLDRIQITSEDTLRLLKKATRKTG